MNSDGAFDVDRYAFDVTDRLRDETDPAIIFGELTRTMANFGFSSVIVSGVPIIGERLQPLVMMHQWPEGWWDRYNELNYGRFDPALHRVLQSRDPFRWTDTRSPNLKRDQLKVLDEAGDFGLRDGLIVPIHDTDGFEAAVSFGCDRYEISTRDQAALHLISMYGYMALRPRQIMNGDKSVLSPRETECVRWTAEGKTSWEIGEIIGIAEATVIKHIHSAERKMRCGNKPQLVARALRAGIIH